LTQEIKKISCKKCGIIFETEIIRMEKEVEYCTNNIDDVRTWKVIKKWSRVKHSKCKQCRNMQKACDYINGLILGEAKI
tara:strand:+ start:1590 stop:1826 length:237 start_codon:yes stop_codon:yes gene_type:complete